jgi:hypothetical protein
MRYEVLRSVIELRDGLQPLWDETAASHGSALEQLRKCAQAEGGEILAFH